MLGAGLGAGPGPGPGLAAGLTPPPLLQNLTKEQADYCLSHMKPYLDSKGRELPSAFDFVEFTRSLFVN